MSHAQIRVPSREQAPANNPLHGHPHNRLVIAAKVLVMPVFSLPGTSSAELDVYPVKIESDSSSLASVGRRLSGKIIGKNCEKLVSRLKHHLLFQSIVCSVDEEFWGKKKRKNTRLIDGEETELFRKY